MLLWVPWNYLLIFSLLTCFIEQWEITSFSRLSVKKQSIYLFILCLIHFYWILKTIIVQLIITSELKQCISRKPVVIVPSVLRCSDMYISIQPPFHSWEFTAFCGYSSVLLVEQLPLSLLAQLFWETVKWQVAQHCKMHVNFILHKVHVFYWCLLQHNTAIYRILYILKIILRCKYVLDTDTSYKEI